MAEAGETVDYCRGDPLQMMVEERHCDYELETSA